MLQVMQDMSENHPIEALRRKIHALSPADLNIQTRSTEFRHPLLRRLEALGRDPSLSQGLQDLTGSTTDIQDRFWLQGQKTLQKAVAQEFGVFEHAVQQTNAHIVCLQQQGPWRRQLFPPECPSEQTGPLRAVTLLTRR